MPKYYFLNRPPSIGTHPNGAVATEVWMPRQDIPGTERPAFGWAEYPDPLQFEQVWQYELFPDDEAEQDLYWEWRDENDK